MVLVLNNYKKKRSLQKSLRESNCINKGIATFYYYISFIFLVVESRNHI